MGVRSNHRLVRSCPALRIWDLIKPPGVAQAKLLKVSFGAISIALCADEILNFITPRQSMILVSLQKFTANLWPAYFWPRKCVLCDTLEGNADVSPGAEQQPWPQVVQEMVLGPMPLTQRVPSQLQTLWYLLLFRFILWDQPYCGFDFFLSSFKANNI